MEPTAAHRKTSDGSLAVCCSMLRAMKPSRWLGSGEVLGSRCNMSCMPSETPSPELGARWKPVGGMTRILHLVNGDSVGGTLAAPHTAIWRDVLYEGPVPRT